MSNGGIKVPSARVGSENLVFKVQISTDIDQLTEILSKKYLVYLKFNIKSVLVHLIGQPKTYLFGRVVFPKSAICLFAKRLRVYQLKLNLFVYPLAEGMKEIQIFLSLIKHKFRRKRTRKPAVSKLNVERGICFILIVHIKVYL